MNRGSYMFSTVDRNVWTTFARNVHVINTNLPLHNKYNFNVAFVFTRISFSLAFDDDHTRDVVSFSN